MSNFLDAMALVTSLRLPPVNLYLIGDGSGTTARLPCGWFVSAIDVDGMEVKEHKGCANGGSNNYAELMPYVHALWFFHARNSGRATPSSPVSVCIVSDSEITVKCGAGVYSRIANASLWAAINWFEMNNYDIMWRWIPRNSTPLHIKADKEAGRLRKLMVGDTNVTEN